MHIGELADRAGMSLRTIRHYDEVGLLVPSGRTTGGFRVYTAQDLERLLVIRRMKPLGFTLDEMAELLRVVDALAAKDPEDEPALAARLDAYLDDARTRHAKLVERAGMAEEFIGTLGSLRASLP
ncbi:MerR family transcriptional regulator [Curtobacterium sp. VKM Ac-2889]|jgi:DNA-binding transcriptional MerR regulator|uniref:MerR family transcriptional regulator n=3 Tax=Microbacteriaceae TaxID=85023 RepID=A0A9Q2VZD1_9MICO|nr:MULTISPECIES: MerR family transcriptional regulator [Curtobacterium]KIQ10502.1 MerR family transcriptional regulator [Curtobacterium flaccumfaciens]MBF4597061.1 MerR family transcriptional regulator [Curtobacterium sp. VKM Ac-1796]MBF4609895.1 MerR family transcriptional regulator [Curtobacterium sp. VKM Ac-2889]MBT1540377.1 MerR family transcriptional regulator [Curtobacterium flaccumfaciens pv. flaccumfaciens]MBT1609614.1 MerR family transcriptional regulator [Curtobacterium flaccumfacien